MATNVLTEGGKVIQYTHNGADLASGDYKLLGDQGLAGVCLEDIANGATGSVLVPYDGPIISMSVKGHNGAANVAVDAYDRVYVTAGEAFFDVDPAQKLAGYTLGTVSSGATETEDVLLVPPVT